jgi:hypothetical protein
MPFFFTFILYEKAIDNAALEKRFENKIPLSSVSTKMLLKYFARIGVKYCCKIKSKQFVSEQVIFLIET